MKHILFSLILITTLIFSCKKPTVVDPSANPWVEIPNLSLNSTINRLHATDDEMLIGTVDNFARMSSAGTIIERRTLEVKKGAMSKQKMKELLDKHLGLKKKNDDEFSNEKICPCT